MRLLFLLIKVLTFEPPRVRVPVVSQLFAAPAPVNTGLRLSLSKTSSDCELELPSLILCAVRIPTATKSPFPLRVATFLSTADHLNLLELLFTDCHKADAPTPIAKAI